ncbi:MAG: paraquat-inducible protein A [Rhodospirillales bacterium]|nr:paraquat-inducible protein A [Rhodospirillales bacterium]
MAPPNAVQSDNKRQDDALPCGPSLAHLSGRHRRWIVGPLLIASLLLLVAAWLTPIMTVEAFVFIGEEVSILGSAVRLWRQGEVFLSLVLAIFSILLPLLKLAVALYLWFLAPVTRPGFLRTLNWIELLGKWSMLDVFVVALAVVALQISIVSDVALHAGIYLFTLAVTLSLGTVSHIASLAKRLVVPNPGQGEQAQ